MKEKSLVRIVESELKNFKNVKYGNVKYVNYSNVENTNIQRVSTISANKPIFYIETERFFYF